MHLQVTVDFIKYVLTITTTCQHLQKIKTKANKEKMPKLMRIIDVWDNRCTGLAKRAENQLRSMGDAADWHRFYEDEANPFKQQYVAHTLIPDETEEMVVESETTTTTLRTTRKPVASKENPGYQPSAPRGRSDQPILIKPLYHIGMSDSHPRLEYHAETQRWTEPAFFTDNYKEAMRRHVEPGKICTILDVFSVPPEMLSEADLDCDHIFLAEMSPGSPYFNPVFMQPADLADFRKTKLLDLLRRVYMSHDVHSRDTRQLLIAAGVGAGVMAKAAVDKVLGWMGYHSSSGAEIKKINANQDHVEEIAAHVEKVEALAGTLTTLTRVVKKEEGYMSYLMLLVGRLQLLFSEYEEVVRGLEVLARNWCDQPCCTRRLDIWRNN